MCHSPVLLENNRRINIVPWYSIETAPKDGTEILAYIPMDGINIVYWKSSGWDYVSGQSNFDINPTHWMPLPDLPKQIP
jgi:Protein of unknown function (DUF551)